VSGRVDVERRGAVTIARIDDPASMNAVTGEMIDAMTAAARAAPEFGRALLLCGSERAFCSGANLAALDLSEPEKIDPGVTLERHINPLMAALRGCGVPVVTAVRGAAAGVGASIALAGDVIVAGESAYFLQAFTRIGLAPDGGSTWLLAKSVGRVRAMEMMLLGEKLPARKALEWGMITRVVPEADVDATGFELAERLSRGPTHALAITRRLAWEAAERGFLEQLDNERDGQSAAGRHPDFREGVAAFLERRPASFFGGG